MMPSGGRQEPTFRLIGSEKIWENYELKKGGGDATA
jgi:hypothetical protein